MITQEEISKLADEYAEYLSSDNKVNREMIALDCLGFVSGVLLDKYHIVSKEEIKDFHQFATRNYKLDWENGNEDGQASFWRGQMELLKTIFGKEALDSDAGE